jgi:hypothetical protein
MKNKRWFNHPRNIKDLRTDNILVDGHSHDRTVEVAKDCGLKLLFNLVLEKRYIAQAVPA